MPSSASFASCPRSPGSEVPVPKTSALCEDASVIGTAFYVMEYVEGRILWDPTLPGMTPEERAAHYDELNRVIAALHRFDFAAAGLADFGKPGNYIERQIARWSKQYQAAGAERIPAMDRLIEWLPRHVPPGDETSLVHGDYRIDNAIFHPTEPRMLAVLDWELSTLGHPLSDFAYQVMAWRLAPQEFRGLKGCDFAALGIPTEAEYVAAYCRRTGRDAIPHWDIYLIFNMFRIAAILHGVLARALQGNAASANAIETGGRARLVADVAWGMAQVHRRVGDGPETGSRWDSRKATRATAKGQNGASDVDPLRHIKSGRCFPVQYVPSKPDKVPR